MKRNIPILGFIIGLLLPFVGLIIMYFLWGNHEGIFEFVRLLTHLKGMAGKVFTLSLLLNLAPFVYYTSKRLDLTAKGIFIATMIYAVIIIFVKYVW